MSKRIFSKELYAIQDKNEDTSDFAFLSSEPVKRYDSNNNDDISFNSCADSYIGFISDQLRPILGCEKGKCRKIKLTVTLLDNDVQVPNV